jgi:hypothetical protein
MVSGLHEQTAESPPQIYKPPLLFVVLTALGNSVYKDEENAMLTRWVTKGSRSVASRKRTANAIVCGALFIVVAFVAGYITTAFTDSWV